jgi:hypothetical protein
MIMEFNKDVLYYNSNFTNSVVKYPDYYPQIVSLYKELKGRRLELLSPEYEGTEWKLSIHKAEINPFSRLYLYIFYGNPSRKIVAFILRGKNLDKNEAGILLNVLNEAKFKAKNIKLLTENWKNISAVVDVNLDSLLGIKKEEKPVQPSQPSTPTIMPDLEEEAKKKRIELAIKLIFALAVLSIVVFLLMKVGGRKK